MIIKPNKRSYIFSLIFADIIAVLFFGAIIWYFGNFFLFFTIFIFSIIFILYSCFTAYYKENYKINQNNLEINYGGVFNENKVNINYSDIQKISLEEPIWQKLFFGTGNIIIKRKNIESRAKIFSLNNPKIIIQNIIKNSGKLNFSDKNNILLEAKIDRKGLDLDFSIKLFTLLFCLVIYGIFVNKISFFEINHDILILFGLFLSIIFGFHLYSNHKDLKNRKYVIFNSGIYFVEGFFVKKHFLVPINRKVSIDYKREFIEKLFGEGCRLEEKTVYFKNIFSGKDLVENIKSLLNLQQENLSNPEKTYFYPNKTKTILIIGTRSIIGTIAMIITPNDYKILEIILITLILIKLLLIFIKNIGYYFVFDKLFFRVKHNYLDFLNHKLATDKITSVIFSENIFDKILGTYSITFWALEKDEPIQFSNIKKSLILKEYITKIINLKIEPTKYNIISNFRISHYIKSKIYIILWNILLLIITSLILIFLKIFVLMEAIIFINILYYVLKIGYDYYHSKTAITHFKPSYIYHKSGIIKQEEFFISYDNINDICSTQYIGSHNGKLSFDIAGERVINTPYGKIKFNNALTLNFIKEVFKARNALENLIRKKEIGAIENSYYTRSEVKNEILKYFILSLPIITIPIILPFAIYDILHTGVKSYYIKGDKIIEKTGIINQKESSILISKIKNVNIEQGFTGRFFNNANIEIITIGEGRSNLKFKYIKNYKELYNKINEILIAQSKEDFKE
ncbi:MAG: PH domain-containing protein [Candidatus Gracilibacteria bacterium]|nr:PH domain-containing protein [Candidatus Gracilibacteria bacterium]